MTRLVRTPESLYIYNLEDREQSLVLGLNHLRSNRPLREKASTTSEESDVYLSFWFITLRVASLSVINKNQMISPPPPLLHIASGRET
jgi:hypothetical protein